MGVMPRKLEKWRPEGKRRFTELAQDATQGVDASGAGGEPGGAQTMKRSERLLGDGLDRHRLQVGIAVGLEQGLGVGAVGLVATAIGADVLRWE